MVRTLSIARLFLPSSSILLDELGQWSLRLSSLSQRTMETVALAIPPDSTVRGSVSIDWTVRESVRAKIRVMVRRILSKFGYPPDLREEAVKLVLEQAETLCAEWAG